MDWNTLLASERHEELVREAESYNQVRQALAGTNPTPALSDRALLAFGRWMVSAGKRLQARHQTCVDTVNALYTTQFTSHHS